MVELTKGERDFLEIALTCIKAPPEIDVPQIAKVLNIKNKSVTNKWWEIKKKLWPNPAQAQAAATAAGGGGGKRKRPVADVESDTADEENLKPPPPKATKQARAKKTQSQAPAAPPAIKTEAASPVTKTEQPEEDEHKFNPAVPTAVLPTGVTYTQATPKAGDMPRVVGNGQFPNFNGLPGNMYQHPVHHNGLPANYQQSITYNGLPANYPGQQHIQHHRGLPADSDQGGVI